MQALLNSNLLEKIGMGITGGMILSMGVMAIATAISLAIYGI